MLKTKMSRRSFLQYSSIAGAVAASALIPTLPGKVFAALPGSLKGTHQETRLLMGTIVTLTVASSDKNKAKEGIEHAFQEIERLIAIFDRYAPSTALGVLNAEGQLSKAPKELCFVLSTAAVISQKTSDAFNPAITPLVDLYSQAHAQKSMPDKSDIAQAMALSQPGPIRINGSTITLDRKGMRLTLDGIAKGYIADMASAMLGTQGLKNHMVNAGGDIRVSGLSERRQPWTIGIENPLRGNSIIEAVQLSEGGIATSGGYEAYYDTLQQHHHIISHRSGQSPAIRSITVKAPTTMLADSLATGLSLLPPGNALKLVSTVQGAECLIIGPQGERYTSSGWG